MLATLLRDGLVVPTCDVWSLFIPTLCPRSQVGVDFLASYLSAHDLVEDYHPNVLVSVDETQGSSYPLRHQLLDWLLPSGDDLGEGRTTLLSEGISDWTMLAETLVTLTERDTHLIKIYRGDTVDVCPDELSKIEAAYLRTSFDLPLGGATERHQPRNRSEDGSRGSHLGVVRKRLEELLQRDATPLLNVFEPDVSMSNWMFRIKSYAFVAFASIMLTIFIESSNGITY